MSVWKHVGMPKAYRQCYTLIVRGRRSQDRLALALPLPAYETVYNERQSKRCLASITVRYNLYLCHTSVSVTCRVYDVYAHGIWNSCLPEFRIDTGQLVAGQVTG